MSFADSEKIIQQVKENHRYTPIFLHFRAKGLRLYINYCSSESEYRIFLSYSPFLSFVTIQV